MNELSRLNIEALPGQNIFVTKGSLSEYPDCIGDQSEYVDCGTYADSKTN